MPKAAKNASVNDRVKGMDWSVEREHARVRSAAWQEQFKSKYQEEYQPSCNILWARAK